MSDKNNFCGLGHISIVVDNIDTAIEFYKSFLCAEPYQIFRNFKNEGFALAAGFLDNPNTIVLDVAFLKIPQTGLVLELMQYIAPQTTNAVVRNDLTAICGVRHIAISVKDIYSIFEEVSQMPGITLINENPKYIPYKIDNISSDQFQFFNCKAESDSNLKLDICRTIGNTYYFYCIDQYGVQWEFEQGHSDLGTENS